MQRFDRHMSGYPCPMLSVCTEPGCTTLVFGIGPCLVHERRAAREFVRGRPYLRKAAESRARLASAARRTWNDPPLIVIAKH
jgi:hypothetical protein